MVARAGTADRIQTISHERRPFQCGAMTVSQFYRPIDYQTPVGNVFLASRLLAANGSPRLTAYELPGILRSKMLCQR